jgi:hypothetical protein
MFYFTKQNILFIEQNILYIEQIFFLSSEPYRANIFIIEQINFTESYQT